MNLKTTAEGTAKYTNYAKVKGQMPFEQLEVLVEVRAQAQPLHQQMQDADAAATDRLPPPGQLVVKVAGLEHRPRLIGSLFGRQGAGDSVLAIAENLGVVSIHSKCPFLGVWCF